MLSVKQRKPISRKFFDQKPGVVSSIPIKITYILKGREVICEGVFSLEFRSDTAEGRLNKARLQQLIDKEVYSPEEALFAMASDAFSEFTQLFIGKPKNASKPEILPKDEFRMSCEYIGEPTFRKLAE